VVHAHVTAWFLGLVLFFVAYFLPKQGKPRKIVQMTLRLFYILILLTGAYLVSIWQFQLTAIIKGLVGLWIIYSMEFVLTRNGKGLPAGKFWVQFVIGFALALYIGYGVLG
jgi:hypothetical protein